ncbi:MAG TPA: TonB-dependent receptor, partial [Longimicrobiales bacterium]
SVLEEVKLRAAWGQSGNQPLFGQKFTPLTGNRNIEGLPGLLVSGIAGDPNIEPERQNEIEAGTDISLFSGRGSLELTVYQRNISNLLLERTLAPSTGFTAQIFNGGELRVRGIELAVAGTPIERGGVTWITRATYAANRSKVIDLPVPPFRTGGFGTALGAFQIEVGASATQIVANAGLEDNGDLIIRKVGDANPDFKISFLNDVTVGPFSVAALLDWQKGSDIINLTRLLYDFGANSADYDTNPRQETIANIATNGTEGERRLQRFLGGDTRPYIEDGSYVKLREVALAYRVPQSFVNSLFRGGVNDLTFRVAGRNLLTISDYTGLDPEVSNFGNQAIARNIDVAPFPPSRSFWISLDVNF